MRKFLIVVFILLTGVSGSAFAAALSATLGAPASQAASAPPPGFADVGLEYQNTVVTVYFGDQSLGTFDARFNNDNIIFTNPDKVLEAITALKPSSVKDILAALQQTLPLNASNLCTDSKDLAKGRIICTIPQPEVASVIVDTTNYNVYLFIAPQYLSSGTRSVKVNSLPNSTAGFSSLSRNNFLASREDQSSVYSINNTTLFGSGDNNLMIQSVLQSSQSSGATQNQFLLQQAVFNRYSNGYMYQGGMFTTQTNDSFLNQQNIFGASVTNHSDVVLNASSQQEGSAIQVFLALPSQVRVYKQGQLIYSQNLPSGNQYIDTSAFPTGSYDVTIQVLNQGVLVQTLNRFFVKMVDTPLAGENFYYASLGALVNTTTNIDSDQQIVLPTNNYSNVVALDTSDIYGLTSALSLENTLMSDGVQSYLSSGLQYLIGSFSLEPLGLVSTHHYYGTGFEGTYSGASLYGNLVVTKLYHNNNAADDYRLGAPLSYQTFDPLLSNDLYLYSSVSYVYKSATFSLNSSISEAPSSPISRSYGASYSQTLFNIGTSSFSSSLSVNRSDNIDTYLASLNISFGAQNLTGYLNTGYGNNNPSNASANTSGTSDASSAPQSGTWGKNIAASLTKNFSWGNSVAPNQANISGNYSNAANTQQYQLSSYYQSSALMGLFDIDHQVSAGPSGSVSTAESLTLNNTVAYSDGHITFGYDQGFSNGVMVNVVSSDQIPVKIFVDGNPVAMASTNHLQPIFLQPYQTYYVSIEPEGGQLYSFDTKPKAVTIYQGNVQYLQWQLQKQFILFAVVHTPQGAPLVNALLQDIPGYNSTDDSGNIQVSIFTGLHTLHFINAAQQVCEVVLPVDLAPTEGQQYLQLDKPLICQPMQSTDDKK